VLLRSGAEMSADDWTGRVIDGRYVVESTLGSGGMGVVLRARHRFTNAQVALKMLRPDLQFDRDLQERFLAEARAPSTIGHPGIVQVLDAGKTPEGELYLAMELLAGRTLRHAMYPSLAPQVARRIVIELLDALGAAHAHEIVHRDLKPENVFLVGPTATVKLLDFGIAKVVATSTRAGYTAAGAVLGTLSYMAPEQMHDASSVDLRADLWAVGVLLYELLSGRLPYEGAHLSEMMEALATKEPDPISRHLATATPAIDAFFTRALARDRTRRFASTQEMALAISALPLDGSSPMPVVPSTTMVGPGSMGASALGAPRDTVATLQGPTRPVAPPAVPEPHRPGAHRAAIAHGAPSAPPGSPIVHAAPPARPAPAGPPVGYRPPTAPHPLPSRPGRSNTSSHLWLVLGAGAVLAIVAVVVLAFAGPTGSRTTHALCEDGCDLLGRCAFTDSTCVPTCEANPHVQNCLRTDGSSCEAFAKCMAPEAGK